MTFKKKKYQRYLEEIRVLISGEKNEEIKAAISMQYIFEIYFDEDEESLVADEWIEFIEELALELKDELKYSEKIADLGYLLTDSLSFIAKNLIFECIENEIAAFEHLGIQKEQIEDGVRRSKVHLLKPRRHTRKKQ